MSPVNYTFGPPGLNNLACQWFSNLHFNSGVLPVISERMLNLTTNLDVVLKNQAASPRPSASDWQPGFLRPHLDW